MWICMDGREIKCDACNHRWASMDESAGGGGC